MVQKRENYWKTENLCCIYIMYIQHIVILCNVVIIFIMLYSVLRCCAVLPRAIDLVGKLSFNIKDGVLLFKLSVDIQISGGVCWKGVFLYFEASSW